MNDFVLVSGGAGYIGSSVCKSISESGRVPVVFDNLSTGHERFVKWGPLFKGDLKNPHDIRTALEKYKIKDIVHMAAKAYVSESVLIPDQYYETNVVGSINLINEFLRNDGRNFVFSSSCATYGIAKQNTISESTPQSPINPYGFTKLVIEKYLQDLRAVRPFGLAILRYFNAAGADLDSRIGEIHEPETHLIPSMINASLRHETFRIFGKDFSTPDGSAIRDFVHIKDLAVAHRRSLELLGDSNDSIICNLGTGSGNSIMELVNLVIEHFDPKFKFIVESRRNGDPDKLVASSNLSRKILNLDYSYSKILNILEEAFEWGRLNAS